MGSLQRGLSKTFDNFVDSEKSGGILLLGCTAIAIMITNSGIGPEYVSFWRSNIGGLSLGHWVNDALMAIFFCL